ncbi:hypothetical protein [Chamaesiphon sp.]|uniref:hypothetical protein n=1 Tax=Chamaesiphon sp. TaxID=2814140 RepID=UPI0035937477
MSQANAYKNLVASRKPKPDPLGDESNVSDDQSTVGSVVSLPESAVIAPAADVPVAPIAALVVSTPQVAPVSISPTQLAPVVPTQPKKRGRPATGKRSDDAWIGRTYYVQRETDLDVEDYLLKLKRQGIEIDKSELVDFMLAAWAKWQQGENIDILLDEFTPRQKGK